jgi:hypothetical protein
VGTKVRYSRVGRRGVTRLSCWTVEKVGNRRDLGGGGGVSLFSLTFGADLSASLAKVWVEGVESGYESEVFTGRSWECVTRLSCWTVEEVKYRRDLGGGRGLLAFKTVLAVVVMCHWQGFGLRGVRSGTKMNA